MIGRRVVAAALVALLSAEAVIAQQAAPEEGAGTCYRVNQIARSTRASLAGLEMILFTVAQEGTMLRLRMGIRNQGKQVAKGMAPIPMEQMMLGSATFGLGANCVDGGMFETEPLPKDGLPPHGVRVTTLVFQTGGTLADWGSRPLTLRVGGFLPMVFMLDKETAFAPPDEASMQGDWTLNAAVRPKQESLAFIPLTIERASVAGDTLNFVLRFQNASRYELTWQGDLSGHAARLITGENEVWKPVRVSPSLDRAIAPATTRWASNEVNIGTVSFRLPHPHAMEQIALAMPGYEPLTLVLEPGRRRWVPSARPRPEQPVPSGVDKAQAEEALFASLQAMWKRIGGRLLAGDEDGYLAAFVKGSDTRAAQEGFVQGLRRIPVARLEFVPQMLQHVTEREDGAIRGLKVELRYSLKGLPEEQEFLTVLECDLAPPASEGGERLIQRLRYRVRPPFWVLGYGENLQSEHFVVFHKNSEESTGNARLALAQLERSYQRLSRTQLPLGDRYVALVVPEKEDFQALTGRDPVTFSGATSSSFIVRDHKLRVVNQAVFINDFRFFSLQRAWGKRDRQVTITHELVHLALANQTRPWTPSWLVEGVAMHYAGQCDRSTRAVLRRGLTPDLTLAALSRVPFIGAAVPDPARVGLEYQFAGETAGWIESKFGEETLLRLYRAFSSSAPAEWLGTGSGAPSSETAHEPLELQNGRLRTTLQVVPEVLGGWQLSQLDLAVRMHVGG